MSGPAFAEAARARDPGLRVIFMSGYPAEAAKRNGFLGSDQVLLNKPFQMSQLAQSLRAGLEIAEPQSQPHRQDRWPRELLLKI